MNRTIFLIFLTIIISCKKTEHKIVDTPSLKSLSDSKNFFDFDQVIHYEYLKNDANLEKYGEEQKKYSSDDKLRRRIIIGKNYENGMPKSETDTLFLEKLEILGFKKKNIDKKYNKQLNNIFSENVSELFNSSCFPFYRDILVFKKHNKTVGMTKICFECGQSLFYGQKNNTTYFGQKDEYEQLVKILNKQIE